jgi:hypothetical protein
VEEAHAPRATTPKSRFGRIPADDRKESRRYLVGLYSVDLYENMADQAVKEIMARQGTDAEHIKAECEKGCAAFKRLDADGSGFLSRDETQEAFKNCGMNPDVSHWSSIRPALFYSTRPYFISDL